MHFKLVSEFWNEETFAKGQGIRDRKRLMKVYGLGHWRKRKGFAQIELEDGSRHLAELHWYEAAGIGKKEIKVKRLIRSE
ncbi:MAG: hypothetical protein ACR2QW_04450 [bacterium]